MRMRSVLACLLIAGFAATVMVVPAQAAKVEIITHCGQIITKNAILAKDLTCTTGFPVAAVDSNGEAISNLTVDLRHHRVSGPGRSDPLRAAAFSLDSRYYSLESGANLTIVNGRIDHWAFGLLISLESYGGTIDARNLSLDHNGTGLYCFEGSCLLKNSRVSYNVLGVGMEEGSLTLVGNRFSHNTTGSEARFFGGAQVSSSVYDHNRVGIRADGTLGVSHTTFSHNATGVVNESGYYAAITDSVFKHNRDGLYLPEEEYFDSPPQIGSNTAVRNTRYGIYVPGATDLGDNKAAANGKPCVGVVCGRP